MMFNVIKRYTITYVKDFDLCKRVRESLVEKI